MVFSPFLSFGLKNGLGAACQKVGIILLERRQGSSKKFWKIQ